MKIKKKKNKMKINLTVHLRENLSQIRFNCEVRKFKLVLLCETDNMNFFFFGGWGKLTDFIKMKNV